MLINEEGKQAMQEQKQKLWSGGDKKPGKCKDWM